MSAGQFSVVKATPSAADYQIDLPAASAVSGQIGYFKRLSSSLFGSVRLFSSDLIDGAQYYDLEFNDEFVSLFSNGTTFSVVGE
jgi:hypothetical protein